MIGDLGFRRIHTSSGCFPFPSAANLGEVAFPQIRTIPPHRLLVRWIPDSSARLCTIIAICAGASAPPTLCGIERTPCPMVCFRKTIKHPVRARPRASLTRRDRSARPRARRRDGVAPLRKPPPSNNVNAPSLASHRLSLSLSLSLALSRFPRASLSSFPTHCF